MWGWLFLGATSLAGIVAPYILPAPPAPTPVSDPKQDAETSTQNTLLKISLILGIAVSAFAVVGYIRKGA
jgi:hypothetical protein